MASRTRLLLPLGAVLMAAALVASGCAAGLATPASAQTQEQRPPGIVVIGEGRTSVTPDVAYIGLGVESTAETAKAAMDENATRMTQVIDRIEALGVAEQDIQTSGVNLFPVYENQNGRPEPMPQDSMPRIIGYRASNTVRVTINDISQAGAILDGVVDVGANTVSGIQFSVKDDSQAKQQALTQAVAQAREKADTLAAAIGASITSVASVQEEFTGGIATPRMAMAQDAGMGGTPIMTGELEVTAQVRVTYNFQ